MENSREGCDGAKKNEESPNSVTEAETESNLAPSRQTLRTPFTSHNQVDADLALAMTLQQQERAYMMLRMNSGEGSDYINLYSLSPFSDLF
uniref:Uncharacterized protein n=1 Tax=Nelumbo nucifera TaxID=4432 RepID=A0A822Y731_NELNU|nr:TPA_asm: hypothetical protein HUJ06_028879 [Nelumbo nucifera]